MAVTFTERYVDASATGGGTGTQADPWTLNESLANVAAGDRVNVKAGTYNVTNDTCTTSGTRTSPIVFRGYKTTIGDLDNSNENLTSATDIPVVVTSTAGFGFNNCSFLSVNHMNFEGGPWGYQSTGFRVAVPYGSVRKCRFTSTGTGPGANSIACVTGGTTTVYIDCYFSSSSTAGYEILSSCAVALNCVFEGTGSSDGPPAIESSVNGAYNCLFINCSTGIAISYNLQTVTIQGCLFYNPTQSGTAIRATGAGYERLRIVKDCVFVNQSTAIDSLLTDASNWYVDGCAYYNVATQLQDVPYQSNAITLTADPFVSAANGNFNLNDFPGGGNLLRAKYYELGGN